MKKRTAWVLVAMVAAVAIGAAAVGGAVLLFSGRLSQASWHRSPGAGSSGRQTLYLDLDGPLPERRLTDIGNLLERRPPTLRTIVDSLERAARDPDVDRAVLRINFLPDAGWARVQEIRAAVLRFRKSGKKTTAYLESGGNLEYYLATACDEIDALPSAILVINGLSSEVTFLRGTLDLLGVQAQFEGVGRYKNAPNQFIEKGFTAPHREQMEALLDSVFAQYVDAIAAARKKTPAEVRDMLDRGPYDGNSARAAGLVDNINYDDQLDGSNERVSPGRYVKRASSSFFDSRPKVALIYAIGEIVSGESQSGAFGAEVAGSKTIVAALREARFDSSYRAVLVRIDSPGGSGAASDMMWREMKLASQAKPVIVSMGDVAASGGYYLAMGGTGIVAQPGTITGSIGVFSGKFSLRGLYDKIGVSKEIIDRGRFASIFTEYRPWSEAERQQVRDMNVAFYKDFVTRVAEARGKTWEQVDAVAEGRIWSGTEAREHGLVDRLGGIDTALDWAKEKAGIAAGTAVQLVVLPAERGVFETIWANQEETAVDAAVPASLRANLRWLAAMSDARQLARMPFDLRLR